MSGLSESRSVASATSAPAGASWRSVLVALAGLSIVLTLLFFDTARSMVAIWVRSETYAHGFLILPISLWLVWERRKALAGCTPRPTLAPIALMLPVGLLWLLAHLVDVLVVQQYAYVALLILSIWALVGTSIARFLAFPIGFLLFAVPVGEALTYPMMGFTADFAVEMLRLTGIPVYRDGTFFSIPSGDWSVVEACSGLRYLIASVTLGVLYAYLTYSRLWKRLLFVAFAVVVPVIANGLRAYMIVMIAHLSDMRLATGVDHLIYGWVFFGIVVAIMFSVGALWRDPPSETMPIGGKSSKPRRLAAVTAAAVCAAAVWAALGWIMDRPGPQGSLVLSPPAARGGWLAEKAAAWEWRPSVVGADGEISQLYRSGDSVVGLYLYVYRSQRQGAELVSSANQMVRQGDPRWSDKEISGRHVVLGDGRLRLEQHRLESAGGQRLLVWTWYRVGPLSTSDPYIAKVAEAGLRVIGGRRDGALIIAAAPYRANPQEAEHILSEFLNAMIPSIQAELDRAVASDS